METFRTSSVSTEGGFNKVPWELVLQGLTNSVRWACVHACVCVCHLPAHVCLSGVRMNVFRSGAARGMYYTSKKGQAQTQSQAKG